MLPVTHGVPFTRLQILLYTLLLLAVSVLPFAMHMSGYVYLAGALLLGGGFLYYAIRLMQGRDERVAMQTFGYSIWYLMALFALLLVDHYLPELCQPRWPPKYFTAKTQRRKYPITEYLFEKKTVRRIVSQHTALLASPLK
jgi:hypothetical protein